MNSNSITIEEAYAAMYDFLTSAYQRTQSDVLGIMLSEMSTLGDGKTADPAIWLDWIRCVERAKNKEIDTRIALSK